MITQYITEHWLEWMFAGVTFLFGFLYRQIMIRLKEEKRRGDAIASGVQSLLRESIVSNYNKYQERDFCPIYAKESIKKVYESYHNLGGNDVATQLYHTLLKMPEEPEDRRGYHEEQRVLDKMDEGSRREGSQDHGTDIYCDGRSSNSYGRRKMEGYVVSGCISRNSINSNVSGRASRSQSPGD